MQTKPENAQAIQKLIGALSELSVHGTITYEKLNAIAGKGILVQSRHRHLLRRAVELAERECGCFFECVRNVGIMRMPAEDGHKVGHHGLQKISRGARRTQKRLTRLKGNMSESAQKMVIAQIAALGAIRTIAHPKRVESVAEGIQIATPIPPKDALRMFQKV